MFKSSFTQKKEALEKALELVELRGLTNPDHDSVIYDHNLLVRLKESERICFLSIHDRFYPLKKAVSELIIKENMPDDIEFPITHLSGVITSENTFLNSCPRDLEEFGKHLYITEDPSTKEIKFQTDKDFQNNIYHVENHIGYCPFIVYHREWDGKYFLLNKDGSHHLAALYRQCREQGRSYSIRCRIEKKYLNVPSIPQMLNHFYPVIISEYDAGRLYGIFSKYDIRTHSSGLGYGESTMYFPVEGEFSATAYETSVRTGKIFDLARYLQNLAYSPSFDPK